MRYLLLCALPLCASTIVPGPDEGPLSNVIPFAYANIWPGFPEAVRYQQSYPEFDPMEIDGIAFRVDRKWGKAFSLTIPDVQIAMWTGSTGMNMDAGIGPDYQIVFPRGSLALSGSGPGDWVPITFSDPFLYLGGNLVLEIYIYNLPIVPGTDWINVIPQPNLDAALGVGMHRALVESIGGVADWHAPTAWWTDDLGLVTRFDGHEPIILTVPIPEPGTATILTALLLRTRFARGFLRPIRSCGRWS